MPRAQHVQMTHPDHDAPWGCPVAFVERAKKSGWRLVDSDAPGLFDPAEHTVDDVNDHLAGVDEVERDRILAAERAGKNRTTINGLTVDA